MSEPLAGARVNDPLTGGRVALVTGGARRVGKAIALELARGGYDVVVHHSASDAEAEETVREIRALGSRAAVVKSDLMDPEAPARTIADAVSVLGRLDALVNSAANMMRTPVEDVTVAEWERIFALNLRAPFFLARAARDHLRRARGAIVNIADLAAYETWPAYVPHGISKAGVVQMTRALARAFAPEIRVNGVAPGAVLLPDDWSEESAERLVATTPLGRLGSPEDVARAVAYLLGAEYVTGEVLLVDGGRHVRT